MCLKPGTVKSGFYTRCHSAENCDYCSRPHASDGMGASVDESEQWADSHVARVVALPERDFLPISTSAKLDT